MKNFSIHYCKSLKKTGKPIIITNKINKNTKSVGHWKRKFELKDGSIIELDMKFSNSTGKAKKQGANTILNVKVLK